jgi:hypothetical protein
LLVSHGIDRLVVHYCNSSLNPNDSAARMTCS